MKMFSLGFVILIIGLSLVVRSAQTEDAAERKVVAERLVRENCLICHSAELVSGQRLTPAQWKAEVDKMVGWGSPIPKEDQAILVEYLTSSFSASEKPAPIERMSVSAAYAPFAPASAISHEKADLARGKATYERNCANCHGPEAQGAELGPNLLERASLWRDADLSKIVHEGRGRMPAFSRTIDDDTYADMISWLRSRKYVAVLPR
jgi:mono/diheme cytochrome c family protein